VNDNKNNPYTRRERTSAELVRRRLATPGGAVVYASDYDALIRRALIRRHFTR